MEVPAAGLQAGNRVFCMVDEPAAVRGRIPSRLLSRDDMLHVLTEDEAYMPDGRFSQETFIRNMETMHVLQTHPRVYVNGIIIGNPHYTQAAGAPA